MSLPSDSATPATPHESPPLASSTWAHALLAGLLENVVKVLDYLVEREGLLCPRCQGDLLERGAHVQCTRCAFRQEFARYAANVITGLGDEVDAVTRAVARRDGPGRAKKQ